MNIQYRSLSSVSVNLHDRKDRLLYYQGHYYDNIYFLGGNAQYQGYINLQGENSEKRTNLFVTQTLNGLSATAWFQMHPGVFRVPLVVNGTMLGEYFDADSVGPCLYQLIEEKAIQIAPCFKNELLKETSGKKIGVLGTKPAFEQIKKLITTAELVKRDEQGFDLVIDLELSTHFRNLLYGEQDGICSLSELLLPILIKRIASFYADRGVRFIAVDGLMMSDIEDRSLYPNLNRTIEELLQDTSLIRHFCGTDLESWRFISSHRYDLNQLSKVVSNGIHNCLLDSTEPGFIIVDGKRWTEDNPEQATRTVHVFGPCIVQGLCVVDSKTIPSYLRGFIKDGGGPNIRVENHGVAYGKDLLNDLLYMMATPVKGGDIVIWFSGFTETEESILTQQSVPLLNVKQIALQMAGGMLNNPFHCNAESNRIYASIIYDSVYDWLAASALDTVPVDMISHDRIPLKINPDAILDSHDLRDYLTDISRLDFHQPDKTKGCVVLNANPCTNGHVFLIEEALKQVDLLYVFLVEESKGSFSYIDREYMLSENFKDNPRIRILSGGKVLTSELGFPEYFNRESTPKRINPLLNHKIFAFRIAPLLGITHRFFGSEPYDRVTQELNHTAEQFLPKNGIDVTIIDRCKVHGDIISAKTVRDLYSNKKLYELAEFVPTSTFSRLLELSAPSLEEFGPKLKKNNISYPGMFRKYGVVLDGVNYMLKVADSPEQILGLYCERIGALLCGQLSLTTSNTRLVRYDGKLALLSKNWELDDDAQFFPLASYFEALTEQLGPEVEFSYTTFKSILKNRCFEDYDTILDIFWKISIIDYLLCNSRSAGNIGVIDNGLVKQTPLYDKSTWLKNMNDKAYLDLSFPQLLMQFGGEDNSAFEVLSTYEDSHKDEALQYAASRLNIEDLKRSVTSVEEKYLTDVVLFRYRKLFSK